jgi:hypothetical protein
MTLLSESCKKAKPLAAPIAILILVFQESGSMLGFPTKKKHIKGNKIILRFNNARNSHFN